MNETELIDKLQADLDALKENIAPFEATVSFWKKGCGEAEKRLQQALADNEILREQLRAKSMAISYMSEELDRMRAEIKTLRADLLTEQAITAEAARGAVAVDDELKRLREENEGMYDTLLVYANPKNWKSNRRWNDLFMLPEDGYTRARRRLGLDVDGAK